LSTRTFGILAGVIGSAVGAWFWSRQRAALAQAAGNRNRGSDQGTVIFSNTPTAGEATGL
jgi:hypothetical protein